MREILKSGAAELGIAIPEERLPLFERFYELLEERNKVMNLTAISGVGDVSRLHFLDCAALLAFYDFTGKRVIDVGTGAGFPGMPLIIAEPSMKLTLLDSLGKRVDFLSEATSGLGIEAECIHARAEEAARLPELRDGFDIAVSRAVARLNVLCELCMPFVKTGGVFISMKSTASDDEIDEAASAAERLGGGKPSIFDYRVPGTDAVHRAVVIPKLSDTPKEYPRRFAKIQKSPL